MANDGMAVIVYRIDAADVIESVHEAWRRFAEENGGQRIACGPVGDSLWQHIYGDEVKFGYALLFDRIRVSRTPSALEFRCDSPRFRRDMRLEIVPQEGGRIEFRSTLVAERPHGTRLRLLDGSAPRSGLEPLLMCACCKHIYTDQGWLEVAQIDARMRQLNLTAMPRLSYGICPSCKESLLRAA